MEPTRPWGHFALLSLRVGLGRDGSPPILFLLGPCSRAHGAKGASCCRCHPAVASSVSAPARPQDLWEQTSHEAARSGRGWFGRCKDPPLSLDRVVVPGQRLQQPEARVPGAGPLLS